MNAKRFAIGTLVGGVALFLLGFLLYGILLAKFFEANTGSATGVSKEAMEMWALALGNLAYAALLVYVFENWASISSFAGGLRAGLIIGLLVSLSYDLIMYGTTNIMNLTGVAGDVVVYAIMTGLAGGIIGWVLGRIK